jgi:zinc transport system substrate-binding protein
MDKIRSANPRMKILDLSKNLDLISSSGAEEHADEHEADHGHNHVHTGSDPHTWMSVENMAEMAGSIQVELSRILPGKEKTLEANLKNFQRELDSLDQKIAILMQKTTHRDFLIYHPALTYFARDYGLRQHSLEFEGKSPSPGQMKQLINLARDKDINLVFIQRQFDQDKARVLASEIGGQLIPIDPLDREWDLQMIHIANSFTSPSHE